VQGGAGYIGSHAALLLLELGHRVTIIDNLSRGHLEAVLALEEEQQAKGYGNVDIFGGPVRPWFDALHRPLACLVKL